MSQFSRIVVQISRIVSQSAFEKSTLFLSSFLRYCKDISNLLFSVLQTCCAITSKKDTTNLQKTFMFIFMQKIIFILYLFLKYYNDITNLLFWVFCTCLVTSTKIISTKSQESLKFICKQKINLIPQFFLQILNFKKSWILIDQQHFGQHPHKKSFPRNDVCNGKTRIKRTLFLHYFQNHGHNF